MATQSAGPPDARATGELVHDLSQQVSTLIRQELELAKVELTDKGKQAGIGAGMFGGAGLVAVFGIGALVAAAVLALATAVDAWLSALIVAVVLFAIAGVAALLGKSRVQRAVPPAPQQTIDTTKQDIEATKQAIKEGRS
jgi:uncharacterized membrane protein YqjE